MTNITNTPHERVDSRTHPALRVVIIEDLREVREGLAALINGTDRIRVRR